MTKLIDALSARTHFGKVMEQAEKKKQRFIVSRRGKPQVVILSVEDYLKNIIKQPSILTDIQISAEKAGLENISSEDIDREITAYRTSRRKRQK
jgi:prevent-host-death family protein